MLQSVQSVLYVHPMEGSGGVGRRVWWAPSSFRCLLDQLQAFSFGRFCLAPRCCLLVISPCSTFVRVSSHSTLTFRVYMFSERLYTVTRMRRSAWLRVCASPRTGTHYCTRRLAVIFGCRFQMLSSMLLTQKVLTRLRQLKAHMELSSLTS